MAFLDDVKRFGKNIKDKSKDVLEITKINSQISTEKDKIKELYLRIGEEVYRAYCAGESTVSDETCAQIKEIEDKINELNAKVLELKNATLCPGCGTELTKEASFCSKCGTKINE
ncbi:MAG: zinc ribbon domain-containing protein [Clostridiaceae bacterium]|nr:zinc ribbon domain-containing protein [Clostridiaceae bacterium]